MKKTILFIFLYIVIHGVSAQERLVKVDFESGSFFNHPTIPFSETFTIQGDIGKDISFVRLNIYYSGQASPSYTYYWNRYRDNATNFNINVPPVLKSNETYDFEIITYKTLDNQNKTALIDAEKKLLNSFFLTHIYFDGKNIRVDKPKKVYKELKSLVEQSLQFVVSRNGITYQAPSDLVLNALKNIGNFSFKHYLKKHKKSPKDSAANSIVNQKISELTEMVMVELMPFINSDLVQQDRRVFIQSVKTEKEPFTLPVNFGLYAWNKTTDINHISTNNIDFSYGVGLTFPFNGHRKLLSQNRNFDSFGFSIGVLLNNIKDSSGREYYTPTVKLPVYMGLGIRAFKLIRINAGALILGEKGQENFSNITVIPTIGMALELNVWAGIKK